jgi:hypothetical protein
MAEPVARGQARKGGHGAGEKGHEMTTHHAAEDAGRRPFVPAQVRCLIVANQTLGSTALLRAILQQARRAPASFHLLVPASALRDQEAALVGSEHLRAWPGEDLGFALARRRLAQVLRQLEDEGLVATGDVGPPDPFVAITECLAAGGIDRIMISTLPRRSSRWLQGDLLRRVRRVTALPVTHLEAAPVP